MNKVKIGLRGLNAISLVKKSEQIEQSIAWNTILSNDTKALKQLTNEKTELQKAIEISAFGDKRAIEYRRECEMKVKNAIRTLAAFVNLASGGDEKIISDAGFDVKDSNNKPKPLQTPVELTIKRTNNKGELIISWTPVMNSRNYIVQCNTKNPENDKKWITTSYSTKSRCVVSDLEPGKIYWIRIKAVGAKGMSAPSQPAQIMAA